MAEEKARADFRLDQGALTSVFGLVSGAALMYLTPLVNNVIKPGKPAANFAQTGERPDRHLQQPLHRRHPMAGGTSATAPPGTLRAGEGHHTHTYRTPAATRQVSCRICLGEESERPSRQYRDSLATATAPKDRGVRRPETERRQRPGHFQDHQQRKNASCRLGPGRRRAQIEMNPSTEKYVTLQEPGYYNLRLVAFNGEHTRKNHSRSMSAWGDSTNPPRRSK